MSITLELTEFQAEILGDMLDLWIEGTDAATSEAVTDRTICSPEVLLQTVSSFYKMYDDAVTLKELLRGKLGEYRCDLSTTSNVHPL